VEQAHSRLPIVIAGAARRTEWFGSESQRPEWTTREFPECVRVAAGGAGQCIKHVHGWLRHSRLTATLHLYIHDTDAGLFCRMAARTHLTPKVGAKELLVEVRARGQRCLLASANTDSIQREALYAAACESAREPREDRQAGIPNCSRLAAMAAAIRISPKTS
jgi:hypothetical protein